MILNLEKRRGLSLRLIEQNICCPKCRIEMMSTILMGINVEKCPSCEGIFFDKGETELLVKRHLKRVQGLTRRLWAWLYTSTKTN